jgi:RIO kinase 2
MSRLAAQKEWAFLKVRRGVTCLKSTLKWPGSAWQILHEHQFPVPRPIDQARHCILMEFIDAYPLWVNIWLRFIANLSSWD